MRRLKYLVFLFCSLFFFFPNEVFGANLCTERKYEVLQKRAESIELEWELKFDENDNHYFIVTASNIHEDLIFIVDNVTYEPKDGKVEFYNYFNGNDNYTFKVYGGYDHPCVEEYVATKTLKIPNYNKFYKSDVCQGEASKWEICDEWYSVSFDTYEDFYSAFQEYKIKVENGEIIIKEDSNYFAFIIIVIVLVLILLYLKRKKIYKLIKKVKKGKKVKK